MMKSRMPIRESRLFKFSSKLTFKKTQYTQYLKAKDKHSKLRVKNSNPNNIKAWYPQI
jgi:uncharacterized protein involved in exopolysaccharide biosynthesis